MYHFPKLLNHRIYFSSEHLIGLRFHRTHFPSLSMETKEKLIKVQISLSRVLNELLPMIPHVASTKDKTQGLP